ncbi:MAG: hypothetical protein PHE24_02150 [Patescibacteria group bacterium]|nr:hypothetical protein [Patescibacteria group bacterium]
MAANPGVDVRTMPWWPDLLALVAANNDDFDSRSALIGRFPLKVLRSLDREGLFQIIEELIGKENDNDLLWSAQIARVILCHIHLSIEDKLLDKYEMRLWKKHYLNQPLSWINTLAAYLRQEKQKQSRINVFFHKHF